MSFPVEKPEAEPSFLPQYGFGASFYFADLVGHNQFLFRVYTPKERSPFFDNTEPFFIAPRFDDRFRVPTPGGLKFWDTNSQTVVANATYTDVATHMRWTTQHLSPYITTSFSAFWSIWEAVKRYHHGVKQDIHIAIIDAQAVSDRAVTAAQLLSKASPSERHRSHWKWFRFAQESQAVLVHGAIPGTAVLASVPLVDLLQKLPSYLLKADHDSSNPLKPLSWDYTEQKPNFRLFCRDMSANFLRLSDEERLQNATTGSVELALAFLHSWFHEIVTCDMNLATTKLCLLALAIAQWPGQWWALGHPEITDLVTAMAFAIAEKLHEERAAGEVTRLQGIVDKLQESLKAYEDSAWHIRSKHSHHRELAEIFGIVMPGKVSAAANSPVTVGPMFGHMPTPESSPKVRALDKRSTVPSVESCEPLDEEALDSRTTVVEPTETEPKSATPPERGSLFSPTGPSASPLSICRVLTDSEEGTPETSVLAPIEGDPEAKSVLVVETGSGHSTESTEGPMNSQSESRQQGSIAEVESMTECTPIFDDVRFHDMIIEHTMTEEEEEESRFPMLPALVETASYVATGFLVGAFISLCLFSSHRRTLLFAT